MVQPRIPLLLLLLLCISAAWLVTTQQVPPEQVREYALKSLANINSIQLAGPDDLLSMGWKGELPGRNWRRLATKLATPGSEVKIVAFGGSVTTGYYQRTRNSSWVYEVQHWLKIAFPAVNFTLLNLGRASADVGAAAACWYHYMPPSTDLVFIEYSANGCSNLQCLSMKAPLVAAYESLIRRVIRNAPKAAMMSFAIFSFLPLKPTPADPLTELYANPFYNSGEDMQYVLARRYGIPMVSARDAFYDAMFDDALAQQQLGYTREELLLDFIHPAWIGHHLYGRGVVAYGMRDILRRELDALTNGGSFEVPPRPMPRPVSPLAAQQADGDTWCADGIFFKDYVVFLSSSGNATLGNNNITNPTLSNNTATANSTVGNNTIVNSTRSSPRRHGAMASAESSTTAADLRGTSTGDTSEFSGVTSASYTTGDAESATDWIWSDDTAGTMDGCTSFNCRKFGYSAEGAGKYLEVLINTGRAARAADRKLRKQLLVILFKKEPLKRKSMGRALASCVQGCKCQDFVLDGLNTDKSSQLGLASVEVTKHRSCRVRITILHADGIHGEEFKVMGIAVVPYSDLPPLTSLDYKFLQSV